jgi:hypothetical protein
LVNSDDLSHLFDILSGVKDINGNSAVITPLTVVTQPDLRKIKDSGYHEYAYVDFIKGIEEIYGKRSADLWKEGVDSGLLAPEYHGRDHINIPVWLELCRNNNDVRNLADHGVIAIPYNTEIKSVSVKGSAAYYFCDKKDFQMKLESLEEGIRIFENLFNKKPISFTPPGGGYGTPYESMLYREGIRAVQIGKYHKFIRKDFTIKRKIAFLGRKSDSGIIYTPRNCTFEPHSKMKSDWIDTCLKDIQDCFSSEKPAIISSHRINFVNSKSEYNGFGTHKLGQLLRSIISKFDNIEFMSTKQLIELMITQNEHQDKLYKKIFF